MTAIAADVGIKCKHARTGAREKREKQEKKLVDELDYL